MGFHGDPTVLVSNLLVNFKKALEIMDKHERKDYHKDAVVKMETFVKLISSKEDSISVQLNNAAKDLVARNRKKLQSNH